MRTKNFQKVNTNDEDDIESVQDIDTINPVNTKSEVNKSVQSNYRKTTLLILCAVFTIILFSIAFISGYLVQNWTNDGDKLPDNQPYTVIEDQHNYYIRDESCFSRKCCKAIDVTNQQQQSECATLTIKECVLESENCEWDCGYYRSNASNFNYSSSTSHKRRHKRFYGISTGIGVAVDEDESNTFYKEPETVGELIQMSKLISIDDCGVMYEEELDADDAEQEFQELMNNLKHFSLNKSESVPKGLDIDGGRRRLQQLSGSDIQEPIGQDTSGGLTGPDAGIGCITYESGSGSTDWGGFWDDPNYRYDHICTATSIGAHWVLTSGSCCYPAGGSNFYSNWVYYPKIRYYSEIYQYQQYTSDYSSYGDSYSPRYAPDNYQYKSYKVEQAYTYESWKGGNYDWDFCILKLYKPYYSSYYYQYYSSHGYQKKYSGNYISLDYNIESYLSSTQYSSTSYNSFNSLGYRKDRYSNDYNNGYLLYGWKNKQIKEYSTYYFSYSMDAYAGNQYYAGGYHGAPLYYSRNSKQYCVTSNNYNRYGKGYNYCSRITSTTYTDFYSKVYYYCSYCY